MTADFLLRFVSLCVLLAGAETLHGTARTLWVVPRLGKARAQQLSIVTGSLLAFGICFLRVPDLGVQTTAGLLALGLALAVFMASFDILLGRLVLRRSWAKAFSDLNPATGNLLVFGLAWLVLCPLMVSSLRGG